VSQPNLTERLGIAGSGAIARGLARVAADRGEVILWARRAESADAARADCGDGVRVTTDVGDLAECTYVVEAVLEDPDVKGALLAEVSGLLGHDAILASTTSSLSIEELGSACGRAERFAGIHVFNPVEKMALVELVFPAAALQDTRLRSEGLCTALGKTAVEVPDTPGFVVNRLLFPLLFNAVRLMDEYSLAPDTVDACMKLGAGHPMGPLKLLDFVGLDVATSIGEQIGEDVPARIKQLVAEGNLGRKTGAGFYEYGGSSRDP
jgi:3-hydroxybutyryl-CoA dehydrogenase